MKKYLTTEFDSESPELIHALDEISLWSAPFGIELLENINYKSGIKVLDIGFGTGFPLMELAFRLGDTAKIYGIDTWEEAIKRVKEKIKFHKLTNIQIIKGGAEAIPLGDESVNLITSNNGINNVEHIEKVISECSRILKPGGQFIQTMNLDGSMIEFYDQLRTVLDEMGLEKEISLMYQHITKKRPSLDFISSLLQKNNFEIEEIKHHQFNYRFASGTAMLNHYFIRLAFMESWIKLLPTNKVEQIFDRIETRLNQIAEKERGIKLSIPFVLINSVKL